MHIIPYCQCPENGVDGFPDLKYTLSGNVYWITRSTYVFKYKTTCYLKIMHHDTFPFYIMGLNFFNSYYTVFDQENGMLGFAINKNADERLSTITRKFKKGTFNFISFMEILFVVIIVLLGFVFLCKVIRKLK